MLVVTLAKVPPFFLVVLVATFTKVSPFLKDVSVATLAEDPPTFLAVADATLAKDVPTFYVPLVTTFIMVIYLVVANIGFTFQMGVKTCRFLLC